jgi:hypothetical protein
LFHSRKYTIVSAAADSVLPITIPADLTETIPKANHQGSPIDISSNEQQRVLRAVTGFANAVLRGSHSNLFVKISGDARVWVVAKGTPTGHLVTSNAGAAVWFGSTWAGVQVMSATGVDEHGNLRNVNEVLQSPSRSLARDTFQSWSSPDAYPVKATVGDLAPSVEGFVQNYIPMNYKVTVANQMRRGSFVLPFAYYTLVPAGVNRFGSWAEMTFIVRNGGTDLAPGQGEVVFYQVTPVWDGAFQNQASVWKPPIESFPQVQTSPE